MEGHWKFQGVGVLKVKIFEGMYEPKLEFPEGRGQVQTTKLSFRAVWIFSETTHLGLTFLSRQQLYCHTVFSTWHLFG